MSNRTESIFNTLVLHEKIPKNRVKNLKGASVNLVPLDEKKKLDKYIKQFGADGYKIDYQLPELKNYGRVKEVPYTGLGTFCREVRGYLANGIYLDIDMVNCHPVVLFHLFKQEGLDTEIIGEYVNGREEFLKTESITKVEFLKMINKETYQGTGKVKKLHDQIYGAFLAKIMSDHPEIKVKRSDYNKKGQIIASYLQDIEFQMLSEIYRYGSDNGLLIDVLMHDGFFVRITDTINEKVIREEYLEKFTNLIIEKFGIDMKFEIKKHDQTLESELERGSNGAQKYEDMKTEFEKNHFKIYDKGLFVREKHDEILFFSARGITESCEHFVCSVMNKKGENEEKPFIGLWRTDPNIRIYDTIGCYPNENYCPKNVFNTWRKFEMERIGAFAYKNDELQEILNHIRILCGNEEPVFDYFVKWIGQMIQFPEVKSICPTLISNQGAGKGALIQLFKKMLGPKKVFESTDPSRDVWGGFNGQMANAFLVNLNELSKRILLIQKERSRG